MNIEKYKKNGCITSDLQNLYNIVIELEKRIEKLEKRNEVKGRYIQYSPTIRLGPPQ